MYKYEYITEPSVGLLILLSIGGGKGVPGIDGEVAVELAREGKRYTAGGFGEGTDKVLASIIDASTNISN